MKKTMALLMCVLFMCMPIVYADEELPKEYGSTLIVDVSEPLPEIPTINRRCIVERPFVSEEFVKEKYGLDKTYERVDDVLKRTTRSYENSDLHVWTRSDGGYEYEKSDIKSVWTLISYCCIDEYNDFVPEENWMVDKSEFAFMTAAEACTMVENEIKAIFPDTYNSFDIELIAHPAHAEDMQRQITKILKEECKTQEDLDFYKSKHNMYEGCIAEDDNYYCIEGRWSFDGVPLLRDNMEFPHELSVDGSVLWAIVGKDGIEYLEIRDALYISQEESREPIERTSDEVLTKAGIFLDNLIGMEPINIAKVELVYVPYPIAMYEYEMTPILVLSDYIAEMDRYREYLKVNVITGEIIL